MAIDLLAQGAAWLESMRSQFASSPVTYRRGAATASVLASRGRSTFQLSDSEGAVFRAISVDWLIGVSDLVLNGKSTTPQRGDRVEDADGNIFEVLPFGSYPEWEYSDQYRNTFRVHSKDNGQKIALTPG
jgi:hypothetical protein